MYLPKGKSDWSISPPQRLTSLIWLASEEYNVKKPLEDIYRRGLA